MEVQFRQNVGENHLQERVRNFNAARRHFFAEGLSSMNHSISGLLNGFDFLPQRLTGTSRSSSRDCRETT